MSVSIMCLHSGKLNAMRRLHAIAYRAALKSIMKQAFQVHRSMNDRIFWINIKFQRIRQRLYMYFIVTAIFGAKSKMNWLDLPSSCVSINFTATEHVSRVCFNEQLLQIKNVLPRHLLQIKCHDPRPS